MDYGPKYLPQIYAISQAKNLGNNQIWMSTRYNNTSDEERVISIIAGKMRRVSVKELNGTYLIQNGTFVNSGGATPAFTHCFN